MTIKQEVEQYLKQRGTPDTPKRIKAALGKGERNSSVNRALTALEAEGKLIHRKTGVQNANVIYEWNKDWKPWCVGDSMDTTRAIRDGQYDGISPGMVNPQRKFTVGSAWHAKNGGVAQITRLKDDGCFYAIHTDGVHKHFSTGEGAYMSDRRYDLISPWSEPKPEEASELRKVYYNWENSARDLGQPLHPTALTLLQNIITEIEKLQKPVEKPVDASKRRGELHVNIYKHGADIFGSRDGADRCANKNRLACVPVPWVEGEGLWDDPTPWRYHKVNPRYSCP